MYHIILNGNRHRKGLIPQKASESLPNSDKQIKLTYMVLRLEVFKMFDENHATVGFIHISMSYICPLMRTVQTNTFTLTSRLWRYTAIRIKVHMPHLKTNEMGADSNLHLKSRQQLNLIQNNI